MKPEEFTEKYLPLFQAVSAPDAACVYNAHVNEGEPRRPPDGYVVVPNVANVWNTYADGYRAVAVWIVDSLPGSGISTDISVYPIAFCYRHYLELRLKALIVTGGELFDQELATPNGHDQKALRDAVTPTLYKIWANEQAHQDYQCLSLVIDQFSQFDHRSEAFRYPVDKHGARFLTGLECINIRRLKDALDVVAPTLDAISTEIRCTWTSGTARGKQRTLAVTAISSIRWTNIRLPKGVSFALR